MTKAIGEGKKRLNGYDNLKFVLIFFIVFAHMLEICKGFPHSQHVYFLIYSFHMPTFIFLMGLFARKPRYVPQYIGMYLIFQTLYLALQQLPRYLREGTPIVLQYSTPYWVLWYLLAMIVYMLLTPTLLEASQKEKLLFLAVSVVLALLIGYDSTVGYYFSLSRIVVFLPFFILGHILNPHKFALQNYLREHHKLRAFACVGLAVVLCFVLLAAMRSGKISSNMLYGSYSYEKLSYNWMIRGFQLLTATIWIAFFILCQSFVDFRVPVVSTIGKNTLPVFLLHGFFVKFFASRGIFEISGLKAIIPVLATTIGLLLLLGNDRVGAAFKGLFFIKKKRQQ